MIIKTIQLKNDTPDHVYTQMCNVTETQGIFKACGNCDDKWIMVQFEDEISYVAWLVAMGIVKINETVPPQSPEQ